MQAHRFSVALRYEHTPLHGAYALGMIIIKFRLRISYHHRTGATCLHDELMNDFSDFRSYNHTLRRLESNQFVYHYTHRLTGEPDNAKGQPYGITGVSRPPA